MDETRAEARQPALRLLVPALGVFMLACAAFVGTLSCAVRGVIPSAMASALVLSAFLVACVAAHRALVALGLVGAEPPLYRRPGFWLFAVLALLALPQLGAFGLIDPWESHYAEVAREMLARRDFVSTWWGHEGWFMSKPILTFWLEALSMSVLGAETGAGHVLGDPFGVLMQPEWAVRLPGALFALAGCGVLYLGVAAQAGRAAGALASGVLATAAQWTLATRHALTDTPFVASLAAALGFLLMAWNEPDDTPVRCVRLALGRRRVSLHAGWLLVGGLLCAVGGQVLMLLFSADTLRAGSPGNCGLPSQPACRVLPLAQPALTPALQATLWAGLLIVLLLGICRERRLSRWLLLAGWFCMGLAAMAKGVAGFALPLAAAGVTLVLQGRWRDLRRAELLRGGTMLLLLLAPWYAAMFARHGRIIFDDLVLKHMLGRALDHLHDTNAGEDVDFGTTSGSSAMRCFHGPGSCRLESSQPARAARVARRGCSACWTWR